MSGRADPLGDDAPDEGLNLTGFKPRKPLAPVNAAEIRWTVGMTVERMVAALKRELGQGS